MPLQPLWSLQPPGSDDRLPEEHTKTRNHKNAKDKAPRVATEGLVVVRAQPVGIAHAKLLGRPPASQPHQTLIKDFLNLVLQLEMLADTGWRL